MHQDRLGITCKERDEGHGGHQAAHEQRSLAEKRSRASHCALARAVMEGQTT